MVEIFYFINYNAPREVMTIILSEATIASGERQKNYISSKRKKIGTMEIARKK